MSHPTIPDQIRAAAAGPTPADPEHMHSWLGAGSDAMLAVLEHLEADSLTFARFAAITDTLRRETLRRIADEMDVPTKAELLAGAHFLETPDSSIGSVAALRVAAYLRARAGEIE